MYLNDLQLALPSSNDSNVEYSFASPRPQNFSLPYPIIKYIFTNPSSGKAWKKLIQTCKYFFSKNPVYPVQRLISVSDKTWYADGVIFDSTKDIAKLWVYEEMMVKWSVNATTLLSLFIPKINKCNLRSLEIWFQNLNFDEYQFLTSSGCPEQLRLYSCTISHSDGTLVTFDQLFENVLQLKFFDVRCDRNYSSMFKNDTLKKFADILPRLKELSGFKIRGLTEAFDFASITDFLLKNESINVTLDYRFDALSDEYLGILEKFIAKIIKNPPKKIPVINSPALRNCNIYNEYRKLCFGKVYLF